MIIRIVTVVWAFLLSVSAFAADNLWKIFEVKGKASVISDNVTRALSNEKSLLETIRKGSRVITEADGKVVIASLKNRQAYEIGNNSEVIVEDEQVHAINGMVTIKKGFSLSKVTDGQIGSIVLRGAGNTRSCLKAISPINTTILELTPELRWENNCDGLRQVTITILGDERVVHSAESSDTFFRVPAGVLQPGSRYLWMIDGGSNFDMASGLFNILAETDRKEALERITQYSKENSEDVSAMIAHIYFLDVKGLNEMARFESDKIRKRFPGSEGLRELP